MPHIHEKIDFTVGVFIVHEGKVLLRKHDKYRIWMGVGGHIELDENPIQAAVREAKEEVGLDITIIGRKTNIDWAADGYTEILTPRFFYQHPISSTHQHLNFIYFAASNRENFSQGNEEVSEEIRWFTKDDLQNPAFNIPKTMKYFAEKALETVK
ncbi:MAG TPA: NUDIX domain-containing protein [Candidatus Paceibacterota bacterium]|nr:NUDIX domain-containing protein [Candidatus Paceibacterota bacterium]